MITCPNYQEEKSRYVSERPVSKSVLELEPWYFGYIDKALANTKCKEDGDFLVRRSLNMQEYVISCRWNNTVHHYVLQVSVYNNVIVMTLVCTNAWRSITCAYNNTRSYQAQEDTLTDQ